MCNQRHPTSQRKEQIQMSTLVLNQDKSEVRTLALTGGGDATVALRSWLKGYAKNKFDEHCCNELGINPTAPEIKLVWERRSVSTNTDQAGGYLVGQDFPRFFQKKLEEQDPISAAATVVQDAENAGDLPVPRVDDSANTATHHVGEIAPGNEIQTSSPDFGQSILYSHKFYSSGILAVSNRLLRSNLAEQIVAEALADRIGKLRGEHHVDGNGHAVPLGIFNAVTNEVESQAPAGVAEKDIENLMLALSPAYRANATFVMSSATFAALVALRSGDVRALPISWGPQPRLHNHPVIVTDHAPNVSAGSRSIVFADLRKFIIRETGGMLMFRYREGTKNLRTGEIINFAARNMTGFQSQLYSDATWTDPAAGAVLKQKASQ